MKQDLWPNAIIQITGVLQILINGIVCNGIPIVEAGGLSEMDTETGQGKRRDLVRKAVFGVNFAVLGLEIRKNWIIVFRFVFWDMKPESMSIRQRKLQRDSAKWEKFRYRAEFWRIFVRLSQK